MVKNRIDRSLSVEYKEFLEKVGVKTNLVFVESAVMAAAAINIPTRHASLVYFVSEIRKIDVDAFNFKMKHEIGHVKHNDILMLSVFKITSRIAFAFIFSIFMHPLLAAISIILVDKKVSSSFIRFYEGRADDFAIKHSTKDEKVAGRREHKASQGANLRLVKDYPSLSHKVNTNGDCLNDTEHPSITDRIAKLDVVIGYSFTEADKTDQRYIDLEVLKYNEVSRALEHQNLRKVVNLKYILNSCFFFMTIKKSMMGFLRTMSLSGF